MLVQEDAYLLEEQPLPDSDEAPNMPPLPQFQGKETAPFDEYEFTDHLEEHPGEFFIKNDGFFI